MPLCECECKCESEPEGVLILCSLLWNRVPIDWGLKTPSAVDERLDARQTCATNYDDVFTPILHTYTYVHVFDFILNR